MTDAGTMPWWVWLIGLVAFAPVLFLLFGPTMHYPGLQTAKRRLGDVLHDLIGNGLQLALFAASWGLVAWLLSRCSGD
jgi:hypothetical protein